MVSPSLTERQELEMDSSVRKIPVMRYTIAQIPPGDVYLIWSHTIDSYRQPSAARILSTLQRHSEGLEASTCARCECSCAVTRGCGSSSNNMTGPARRLRTSVTSYLIDM